MSGRGNQARRRAGVVSLVLVASVAATLLGLRLFHPPGETQAPEAAADQDGTRPGAPTRTRSRTATAQPTGEITGRVVGPDGGGVEGARVAAVPPRVGANAAHSLPRMVRAGQGGTFRIDGLAAGRYTLVATAEGFTGVSLPRWEVVPGDKLGWADLRLSAGGVVLSGHVSDASGGPIPGARLSLSTSADPRATDDKRVKPGLYLTEADQDGSYRLQVPMGHYSVTVESDGYVSAHDMVELRGDETKGYRLEPAGQISGRVVTGDGREPVADAQVWAEPLQPPRFFGVQPGKTDDTGAFHHAGGRRAGGRGGRAKIVEVHRHGAKHADRGERRGDLAARAATGHSRIASADSA